jgi:hypothetical protein
MEEMDQENAAAHPNSDSLSVRHVPHLLAVSHLHVGVPAETDPPLGIGADGVRAGALCPN